MKTVRVVGVLTFVLAVGCTPEPAVLTCTLSSDCPSGTCLDGMCVPVDEPDTDAGDVGTDDAADTGFRMDMGMEDVGEADVGMPPMDAGFGLTEDTDGDGIYDWHEGRGRGDETPDTDGDGTPDWMDTDSDGDGLLDELESGDDDPDTVPRDTDFDGMPDYVDLDSDGNGVPDSVEGGGDLDGDGRHDASDTDDDDDLVRDVEEISDPAAPEDTDGDGMLDYRDPDSDNDTILDGDESGPDTDGDATPDIFDADSDGDGYPDSEEAGDADIRTPPVDTDGDRIPDFRDPDSDGDGLSDLAERAAGTSRTSADTDGDGVSDLIEVAAGTDPLAPGDSPRTRGDFVFVVPFEEDPDPERDTLQFETALQKADVYFLMDNTGSMGGTIRALQTGLTGTVIPNIRAEITDAWFGVGGFDDFPRSPYGNANWRTDSVSIRHDAPFFQYQPMTESIPATQTAVNRYGTNAGADTPESGVAALFALASRSNLAGNARFPGNSSVVPACPGGRTGAACFRSDAVPIILVMSDVDQHGSPTCGCNYSGVAGAPTYASMTASLATLNARVVGISTAGGSRRFLERVVTDTTLARGATGTAASYVLNAPGGSGLTAAVTEAVRRAAAVPLDVSAQIADVVEAGETVDAVAAFVDFMETRTTAAPGLVCTLGLTTYDRAGIDTDAVHDTFRDVTPGAPVCFDIVPKMNMTVMPTLMPQIFRARISVLGDGVTPLDSRDVFFLVPPRIPDPNE